MCDGGYWYPISGLLIALLGVALADYRHGRTEALMRDVDKKIREFESAIEKVTSQG